MASNTKTSTKVSKKESKVNIPEDVNLNDFITVRNGFNGMLIYISKRTGEEFRWENFGDEQEIELKELRNAKSSSKNFFINNWFLFDEEFEWVPFYLGIGRYYENALNIDEMNDLFNKTPAQIEKLMSKLSDGQKKSIEYKARYMVNNNMIDSNKVISVLEETLGVELVER